MPTCKRLAALILTWSAISWSACSSAEDPGPGSRGDAGADAVVDAGPDVGLDVGVDAGPCAPAPYNVCPPYSCFQCENQNKPGCAEVCTNFGCMECGPNGWFKAGIVDCDPNCDQKPDAGDAANDAATADAGDQG